jgi:hypothetical protein
MMRNASIISCILAVVSAVLAPQALATTGKGCLRVVKVEPSDQLWLRAAPHPTAKIVMGITPGGPAVIHLDAKCVPFALPYAKRWCPVSIYSDDGRFKGYVKARFVRDSECP